MISNQAYMGCHTSIASIMRDHSGCRCFAEELSHVRKDVTEIFDDKTQRINDKYVAYCFGKSCPTRQDLTKASWTVSHVLPQEVWTGLANYAGHVSLLHYFTNHRSTNEHLFGILPPGRTDLCCYFLNTSDTVKIIKLRIEAWEEIHDTPENKKMEPNQRDLGKEKKHDHKKHQCLGSIFGFSESLPGSSDIVHTCNLVGCNL